MCEGGDGDAEHKAPPREVNVHLFHHFPDGIPVVIDLGSLDIEALLSGALTVTMEEPTPPPDQPYSIGIFPGTPTIQPRYLS